MFARMLTGAIAAAVLAVPAARAQTTELPAYAYEVVADVSLVTTAEARCDGIKTNAKGVQAYVLAMYGRLQGEGYSLPEAVKHFESEFANQRINASADALLARHGATKEDTAAFCGAIRAEAKENRDFRKLVKIGR